MRNYYVHYYDGTKLRAISLMTLDELISWLGVYSTEYHRSNGMIVTDFGFNSPTFG